MLHRTVSLERRQESLLRCANQQMDERCGSQYCTFIRLRPSLGQPWRTPETLIASRHYFLLMGSLCLVEATARTISTLAKSIRVEEETPPASVSHFTLILNMNATSPTSGSCMTHRVGKSTAGEYRVYYSGRGGRRGVCIIRYACDVTVSRRKALAGTGWASARSGGEPSRR
jgi:hypothetical protein